MEKIEGDGMAFLHASGTVIKKELKAGEILKVDTGCIVGFSHTVHYDIEFIGGIRNTIFGGEGMFFATLTRSRHRCDSVSCHLADWPTESLPVHLHRVENEKVKEVFLAV